MIPPSPGSLLHSTKRLLLSLTLILTVCTDALIYPPFRTHSLHVLIILHLIISYLFFLVHLFNPHFHFKRQTKYVVFNAPRPLSPFFPLPLPLSITLLHYLKEPSTFSHDLDYLVCEIDLSFTLLYFTLLHRVSCQ